MTEGCNRENASAVPCPHFEVEALGFPKPGQVKKTGGALSQPGLFAGIHTLSLRAWAC